MRKSLRQSVAVAALAGTVTLLVYREARSMSDAPPPPPPPDVQRLVDGLDLTDAQMKAIDPIVRAYLDKEAAAREALDAQMKQALPADAYEKWEQAMHRPPRRDSAEGRNGPNSSERAPIASSAATTRPAGAREVPVVFSGGYDTDPRDRGRPVLLVAAGLNVPSDVFRKAFTGVTPAPGGEAPDPAQVDRNKQALLKTLGPYGVTNDRLDVVSDYYRYRPGRGQLWRHTAATATATIRNGVVTAIKLTSGGSGYSSTPQISVAGIDALVVQAPLNFTTELSTNGAIREIKILDGGHPTGG